MAESHEILRIVETKDGSNTLFHSELDEHYHSLHGAYQESMHVFIEMGLNYLKNRDKINILEIGFGTGLNAMLTLIHQSKNIRINYHGLELYPLEKEIIHSLGYDDLIDTKYSETFYELHNCDWGKDILINDQFILHKIQDSIHSINFSKRFDLLYFDAFAPRPQPDMWTEEVFRKLYDVMKKGGILVTYCSKGDVRRAMLAAGFEVQKLPGPPGKREMLRASK